MFDISYTLPITSELIQKAYLTLKNYVFKENFNLFLKSSLAKFEKEKIYQDNKLEYANLDKFFNEFSRKLNDKDFHQSDEFKNLLSQIDVRAIPKKFYFESDINSDSDSESNFKFYSNNKVAPNYFINKFSLILVTPIEIHLIDIIWSMIIGADFDSKLLNDVYGNRLEKGFKKFDSRIDFIIENNFSQKVFKYFYSQYNLWRDNAFKTAQDISKNGDSVAILSLDIESFYPSLDINLDKITENPINPFYGYLTEYLKKFLNHIMTSYILRVFRIIKIRLVYLLDL